MQTNGKDVIEINLRDLFFHLLYRWRSLLVAALIGALVLGGYAFLQNRKGPPMIETPPVTVSEEELKARQEEAEAKRLAEEKRVAEANRSPQNMLDTYQRMFDENMTYMEESILMNVDAYHEWQAKAVYTVIPDGKADGEQLKNQDPGIAIAAAYPSSVLFNREKEKLQDIYGETGAKYASELFRCSAVSQSRTFTATAIGQTEEMAKAGLDYLKNTIQAFSEKEGQQLGAHHLALLNEYTLQVVDTDTENQIRNIFNLRSAYQSGITNSAASIQTPAPIVVESAPPPVEVQEPAPKKSVFFFAAIGFLIGFFGLLFVYFLNYILNGKMQQCKVLQRYGIAVFGQFNHSRARCPGKGLDKLIENWEFCNSRIDRATVIGNVCALLKEKASGTVLLTSTLPLTEIQSLCAEIHSKMKESISLQFEEDFLNNCSVVEAVSRAQAIVLIEEKDVSRVKDIQRMSEILSICETPVIGSVVF